MSNNKFKIGSGQIENIFNLTPALWINIFKRCFWVNSGAFAGDFYQHYGRVANYRELCRQTMKWEDDIYPNLLDFGVTIQSAGNDIPGLISMIDTQQPSNTPGGVLDDIKNWIDQLDAQSKYLKPMIAGFLATNREADSNVARAKGFNTEWVLGADHNQLESAINTVEDHFGLIVFNIAELKTWWDMSEQDISDNEAELLRDDLAEASRQWQKTAREVSEFMNPAKRVDETYYYAGDFIYDFYPINAETIFNLSIKNPTLPDKTYLYRHAEPLRRVWLEGHEKARQWRFKRAFSGWYYIIDDAVGEQSVLAVQPENTNWMWGMPSLVYKTDRPEPKTLWRVVPANGLVGAWEAGEIGSVRLVNMAFGESFPLASGTFIDYRFNDASYANLTSYLRVHIGNWDGRTVFADWRLTTVGTRPEATDFNGLWKGRFWSTDEQGNAIDYDTDANAQFQFQFSGQSGQDINGRYTFTSAGEVESQGTVYINMGTAPPTGQIVDDEGENLGTTTFSIKGLYMTGFVVNEDNEGEVTYGKFRVRRDH